MTREEKLENLAKVEKKLRKLEAKGYKLLAELNSASEFHGLAQQFAERDFANFVEWVDSELSSKREFVHKYGK